MGGNGWKWKIMGDNGSRRRVRKGESGGMKRDMKG